MANVECSGTEGKLGGETSELSSGVRGRIGNLLHKFPMGKDTRTYAYTQTFKLLRCKRPKAQFKETVVFLTKTLARACDFALVPEWRFTSGEIHYHGIIHIKDEIKWFKQTLPSLRYQGYVCIKPIDNIEKWIAYIIKEARIAEEILGLEMPITKEMVYEPYKVNPAIMSQTGPKLVETL